MWILEIPLVGLNIGYLPIPVKKLLRQPTRLCELSFIEMGRE
jgi:hypothetical protein